MAEITGDIKKYLQEHWSRKAGVTEDGLDTPTLEKDATIGFWENEKDSADAFDLFFENQRHLFRIEREVSGHYISMNSEANKTKCRIDRILIPQESFVAFGWSFGAIGVELKRSCVSVGRPLSQCLDYRKAIFPIKNGLRIYLDAVFLWPFATKGGSDEGIIAQHRVGGCAPVFDYNTTNFSRVRFYLGQQNSLELNRNGTVTEFKKNMFESVGRNRGSR